MNRNQPHYTRRIIIAALSIIFVLYVSNIFISSNTISDSLINGKSFISKTAIGGGGATTSSNDCMVSFGTYNGHRYKSPGQTIGDGKCLVESKWMRVMQHVVKLTPTSSQIDDWLFIDYHDRINVLVSDPTVPSNAEASQGRFWVFEQSKYSLEGRKSLAVIGGIIEPGEEAHIAAQREVNEEMEGVTCEEFVPLGRFRTDVNRGIGWVNSFLAMNCEKSGKAIDGGMDAADEVGKPDTERQDIISLSLDELRKHAKNGDFLEVQWSNTVALALLHLDSK